MKRVTITSPGRRTTVTIERRPMIADHDIVILSIACTVTCLTLLLQLAGVL
jgi:hypothetical protein